MVVYMPTKAEMLSKLDEGRLKKIAKNEGLSTIPRTFGKRELVKYLDGTLTLEKIKEYVAEVYERETKREIIRETIKERGVRLKAKETTRIELNKPQLISEIINSREKIDKSVLEEIANYLHEPISTGSGYNLYNKMNERMLENIHRIFIKKETDGKGRYLEYQFANFIKRHTRLDVARLKIRSKLPKIGEIDVLGCDSHDQPLVIAECKDRPVKKEDVDKWISNIKRVYSEYNGSLQEAYFVGSNGYTEDTVKRVEDLKEIDPKKGILKMGGVSLIKDFLSTGKELGESGKVFIEIYDVRQNQFVKILPRK